MGLIITIVSMLIMQYGMNTLSASGFWAFVFSAFIITLTSFGIVATLFAERGFSGTITIGLLLVGFNKYGVPWLINTVGLQVLDVNQVLWLLLPSVLFYMVFMYRAR